MEVDLKNKNTRFCSEVMANTAGFGLCCAKVVYHILILPVFLDPARSSEPKHWECLCVSSESAARINTFLLGHGQHTFAAKL